LKSAQTRAAIKRASQQARNAMRELDAAVLEQLLALYTDAADEVRATILHLVDGSDTVPVANLRGLLRQIDDVVDALALKRNELLVQSVDQAAALGVRPYTLPGVSATGVAGQAVLESGAAMKIHQEAVRFVQSFSAADGLTLSNRLWRLNQGAKEVLSRSIGQAVVAGWDASKAAAQFMYSGQTVPLDVQARLGAAKADALLHSADLLTDSAGEVWKAERVFRTEINRAHGTAYMTSAERTPGFAGFKFLLSPQHPKHDICDLLSTQNLYGLGEGVYPDARTCPWPAHPNTLSFVNIVFAEEVTAADRAGKETVTEAMARLSPEERTGVLGVEKSALYDAGKVKPWMIRSPLRAVRERMARQGAAVASAPMQIHPDAIPNAGSATVRAEKLVQYALNSNSESGRHKALVFESVLGYNQSNFEELRQQLSQGVPTVAAVKSLQDVYGQRYTALIPVTGPKGTAVVTTGWILRPGSDTPDLITAYIPTRRNKNV
jgi:hypothetical protein